MEKNKFKEILSIVRSYSALEVQESKMAIQDYVSDLEEKKKQFSNDLRRVLYFFELDNKQRVEEVSVIDEVFLPRQIRYLAPGKTNVFTDVKLKALEQIRTLQTKKNRINKDFGNQQMQVRQLAKSLENLYKETDKAIEQKEMLDKSTIIRTMLSGIEINLENVELTDSVVDSLYKTYREEVNGYV